MSIKDFGCRQEPVEEKNMGYEQQIQIHLSEYKGSDNLDILTKAEMDQVLDALCLHFSQTV